MQNGDTPLLMAVHNGHLAVVKMLIEKYQCSANEVYKVIFHMQNTVYIHVRMYKYKYFNLLGFLLVCCLILYIGIIIIL